MFVLIVVVLFKILFIFQKTKKQNKVNISSSSSDDCEMLDVSEKSCRSESIISVDEEAIGEYTLELSENHEESHVASPCVMRKAKVLLFICELEFSSKKNFCHQRREK